MLYFTMIVHLYLSDGVQMIIKHHHDPEVISNRISGPQKLIVSIIDGFGLLMVFIVKRNAEYHNTYMSMN